MDRMTLLGVINEIGIHMQNEKYREWLVVQNYQEGTITAQMHRTMRVQEHYGDLDELHAKDSLNGLINILKYSRQDQRNNRPNETKVPFDGDAYNNLASYRDAIRRYKRFLEDEAEVQEIDEQPIEELSELVKNQRIGLEKDMQAAIRQNIEQLEKGLHITDGGRERSVETGFIDITAEDSQGNPVVIELKTGVAGQRAVAQILSYIGSVMDEEGIDEVRGILVASDFDRKSRAAARVIPSLSLVRYQFSFKFTTE